MTLRLARFLGLAGLAMATPALPAMAQPAVPLSEYGKLPDVESSAISPSGDRIALITQFKGARALLAIQDQTQAIAAIQIGDKKVRSIQWVGEDRILLITSQTEDLGFGFTTRQAEMYVAQVLPIASNEQGGIVFGNSPRYPDIIIGNYGIRKVGKKHYGFFGGIELVRDRINSARRFVVNHTRPFLFKVDLESLKLQKVGQAAPQGHSNDWLIDAKGEVAFTLDVNDTSGYWELRDREGDRILSGQQERGAVNLVGLGFDGTTAIITELAENGTRWLEVGQGGGEPQPFLPGIEFSRLFFDPQTGHLMGYTTGEDESERHVFSDKTLQDKANRVRKAFSGFEASMSRWTSDLSDVIVRTSGNQDSGTYFAVDLGTNRANALAYERVAIGPELVGPISTFEYTASDGMEMDGILTLPPGSEAKNLPLVMLPHGGPHSADYPVFDWWAQAFASRGYAVFQPNFRGSTNRTSSFRRAGYGEWGRKMQTDKSDGMAALAEAGIIDPSRACIVGASYGGYAALAGVTLQQGLYKCAVAVAPVSDVRDWYQEKYNEVGRERTTRTGLREQLGDPDLWNDVSPARMAERADAPIMLIHGKDDTVVLYSHSLKMADKLKDAGKPYELVTLEGEDHWLSLSATRRQMLENAVRWVETYNPAD